MKTLIIAEAGVNHNGSLNRALELVDIAAEAGADFVKFQTFITENIITRTAEKAEYQKEYTRVDQTQYDMIKKLELDKSAHELLIDHCDSKGISFLSTAFDHDSIDLLNDLGIRLYKIPSGEITNLPYLRHIGRMGKPIIMSTGMSNLDEVKAALDVLLSAGALKDDITLLHCNTEYPTPMADVNLLAMLTLRDELGLAVGYSDHTRGIEVSTAATALKATVIEKHFTLDRDLPGPDHAASLEPHELSQMIKAIRNIEEALGNGVKRPSESEQKNISIVRKSIVAKRQIKIGEALSELNICVKRPGIGISPMRWDELIGSISPHSYEKDELIKI
jgi:N,N'-diacetyllegionaminate synthase